MKIKRPTRKQQDLAARRAWYRHCIMVGAMLLSCGTVARADSTSSTNSPAVKPLTPEQSYEGGADTYNNWVDLSVGGLMVHGNTAQAQQQYQLSKDPFGGISDMHLQQDVAKNTTLTMDGHALFDQNDYKLTLGLQREDFGYVKVNATDFRTWYNGAGGYYPLTGVQYQLSGDDLYIDRGTFSVEAGLTPKDLPAITFKYTHSYRDGDKSSTIWGPVHEVQTLPTQPPSIGVSPSIYSVNEKVDSYALDMTNHIKSTDIGVGVRYETASLSDTLQSTMFPGEPVQQDVTQSQGTSYDMFNAHAYSETWFKDGIYFSAGYMFDDLNENFTGSNIYGDDFNVIYTSNPLNGFGYTSMTGSAHEQEQVANLNLMATPIKYLTIVPSLRVQSDTWNANSSGIGTQGTSTQPFASTSDEETLDVQECLDVRYTGVTNWVYYAGAQLTEGDGNLNQNGGLTQVNGFGPQPVLELSDETRWFQKYFLGARWYPLRRTSIDFGGYYKNNQYNYNFPIDSTYNGASSFDRYPDYLVMQSFQTYDGSVRLTYRPINNVAMVSRYEYQHSIINTTPDAISGLGEAQSSTMNSQIIAQNVTWIPLSRLSLQGGFNYVLSTTETPTSAYTQAVLNSQNNYWTITLNSMVVLDEKTDLNLGFIYYHAGDFNNNAAYGVPLGTGAEQYTATAGITRRITDHLRVNLKYAYTQYNDWASGGNNNYYAQMVYSTLQYRF